ncbi:phosphoglucomutase-like protein 5 [Willisornis vidua]|uniref:Phosphoglucomutase-like protein 5 n=1 Tax=Willisornis vidua TaxID=1566151 RepID=A0ABQ9DCC3_9PASS|nr:phosphoglucomutase-like protein 5 [Willisornis vidua]
MASWLVSISVASRTRDYLYSELIHWIYKAKNGVSWTEAVEQAPSLELLQCELGSSRSDHLREKDGLWAVLVWLSILAARKQSVEEIVRDHWAKFGRHYYCRFDYEALEPRTAYFIMRDLEALITDKSFSHQQFAVGSNIYSVERTDSFEYIDPVDGTVTKRQGLRIIFSDASRLIFRMSASSHVRATLRIYAESYEKDPSQHNKEPQSVLSPLIAIALKISQIHERTGRKGPTVIT